MEFKNNVIRLKPLTESAEQRALVKWIKCCTPYGEFLTKFNNEGKRTQAQGSNLKALGMMPGSSDLFLAYPVGQKHGCWIECKRNKRYTLSERSTTTWKAQEAFLSRMKSVGYEGFFAYGWEEGKCKLELYLKGFPVL